MIVSAVRVSGTQRSIEPSTERGPSNRSIGQTIAKDLTCHGRAPAPQILQDEVYRIAREILRNAFRHAQASRTGAEIAFDRQFFRLRIRDNGKGHRPQGPPARCTPGTLGIAGRPRARETQRGAVETLERTWRGTQAELTVPARIAYRKAIAGIAAWQGWRLFRRSRV